MIYDLSSFYDLMKADKCVLPHKVQWMKFYGENTELWPITHADGTLIGGVLFRGQIVHIHVSPQWHKRWVTRKLIRAYREWKNEVQIYAHPHRDNEDAIALLRHLGWRQEHADESAAAPLYLLFVKDPTCQQQSSPLS